jgi:hypothetical protein
MPVLSENRTRYNEILARVNKANELFEGHTPEYCEKYLPDYNKLVWELGILIKKIEYEEGVILTPKQVLEGV